ncbi:unnamed protein product [Trichogramma brassicae]|uniref:Uncharacterized protein n=1 Tax=Trichogramma brassicae TaxID=86971 RepID=A0A6H5IDG2_9HYME|nr:unnamed protein product [Trichogramma brassicae]
MCDGDGGLHPPSGGRASKSLPARDQRATTRLLRRDVRDSRRTTAGPTGGRACANIYQRRPEDVKEEERRETLRRRIFEVRFFAWCGRACARGGAGTTQKEDPGYVISLRSGKKTPITVRAGSDRITISRSPRRGLTRLAIDGAQHFHDEVRSENHTHKRAPDAGAKAQQERMMVPEARTTLTR